MSYAVRPPPTLAISTPSAATRSDAPAATSHSGARVVTLPIVSRVSNGLYPCPSGPCPGAGQHPANATAATAVADTPHPSPHDHPPGRTHEIVAPSRSTPTGRVQLACGHRRSDGTAVWLDGALVDPDAASVSVFDHGFTVGDGVFETLKDDRRRPFAVRRHLERLARSAPRLGLDVPLARAGAAGSDRRGGRRRPAADGAGCASPSPAGSAPPVGPGGGPPDARRGRRPLAPLAGRDDRRDRAVAAQRDGRRSPASRRRRTPRTSHALAEARKVGAVRGDLPQHPRRTCARARAPTCSSSSTACSSRPRCGRAACPASPGRSSSRWSPRPTRTTSRCDVLAEARRGAAHVDHPRRPAAAHARRAPAPGVARAVGAAGHGRARRPAGPRPRPLRAGQADAGAEVDDVADRDRAPVALGASRRPGGPRR